MTAVDAALDLLAGLVLEDGALWGDRAAPFQWDAARALLDPGCPPFRWESRPRGGSKTTDVGGIWLAAALTLLPAGALCDAYAGDRDQARLLVDAVGGLVRRTPALAGLVTVDAYKVRTAAGVTLEVMAADAASAYGRRPHWVIVDELCQWLSTPGVRELWDAIVSSLPKVPGARLAVITTSGDPTHWSRKVRDQAVASPLWSVAEVAGPLPWSDAAQLGEQRRLLVDSQFARLHLNQWAASEDRLVSQELLEAAAVLDGPQLPVPGRVYSIGVDLGLRSDRTALAVVHGEVVGGPTVVAGRRRRVVLDRLEVVQGSRESEVNLAQVEEMVFDLARSYGAQVRVDPWQATGLAQRLRMRGVGVEEWPFSSARHAQVAQTLLTLLRDRLLWLLDDPGLLDELATVRLRESGSSGLMRVDHASGRHDDRVIALGLAVTHCLERGGWSVGASGARPAAVPYTDVRTAGAAVPWAAPVGDGFSFGAESELWRGTWAGSGR